MSSPGERKSHCVWSGVGNDTHEVFTQQYWMNKWIKTKAECWGFLGWGLGALPVKAQHLTPLGDSLKTTKRLLFSWSSHPQGSDRKEGKAVGSIRDRRYLAGC